MASPLHLPHLLQHRIDSAARALLTPAGGMTVDFKHPLGEQALVAPNSVSWRVFKNPVSLFIGGVAAVILELAEPSVRTGVWEHSSFRTDPVGRMRRTGLAAMVTVYGARSTAETMIAGVVRRHDRIWGETPDGKPYQANDAALLTWVHATAAFGFVEAYSRYVRALGPEEVDRFYGEGLSAAKLYGAASAPGNEAELEHLFEMMRPRLEPSPNVFEFLRLVRDAPAFPVALRGVQRVLVRAAVEMTPLRVRERLGLTAAWGLRAYEVPMVQAAGALSDRIVLGDSPASQSCVRLGLPADYLYR
jgi:uncharacterized protein (DUF2236 family)